jgi:diguanylate cyclase (GGDEF)-like protein
VSSQSTCLPDRTALLSALQSAVKAQGRFALLIINLEKFRDINIEFGHDFGDQVLRQLAERIQLVLRKGDSAYHVGADEFAVVLGELKSPQLAELAARKIQQVIYNNLELQGKVLAPVVRVGAAVFPDHAATLEQLLRQADAAQQKARNSRGNIKVYDQVLRVQEQQRSDMKGNLKVALDNSDLMLYYQPQVDLQQGVISGCEALVRWNHAAQGWISPELFIPVAEGSELIDTLTYWSVNVALREWFKFCGDSSPSASISVNLSAKLLHSPEVVDLIERAMNIWGAPPGALVLEVTESAMMADPKAALYTLQALANLGVKLSIDDFGTGYSSLAYLKNLPVAELKIDKSFVLQMAEDPQDRKIVQSVIDLAHNLDLQVVAEGIENQQSLDMLIGMGCDYGQGYFIARPMPLADLPPWVDGSRWQRTKASTV